MENSLISVIMSTYNEPVNELRKSIDSILHQTYKNIEFIIVDDNPDNDELKSFLESIEDNRVKLLFNKSNLGLVKSLNRMLEVAQGNYIARMDADDIAVENRLEKQLRFLKENKLDIVGGDIARIDEDDNVIQKYMHFPSTDKKIRKYIAWGSCMPHPTWLVKKDVYMQLGGYRDIHCCEDYDFLLRAIACDKYKLGNVPDICLLYRVRGNSISSSNTCKQYLLRLFLAKYFKKDKIATCNEINSYLNSHIFLIDMAKFERYRENKHNKNLVKIIFDKYFYYDVLEKIKLYLRER